MTDTYSAANAYLTISGEGVDSQGGEPCGVIEDSEYTTLPSGERVYIGDTGAMRLENGAVIEYTVTKVS